MTLLNKYLTTEMVAFLSSDNRDDAIRSLIKNACKAKKMDSPELFFNAVIEREKVVTTGIGMGVAIPHAKLPGFKNFFVSIGVLDKGIDWKALDGHPVRLIFLIGGPDDKQTEYLQLLSSITHALKKEDIRKELLSSQSPEMVCQLFK
ncbi:PTS sugar transporter subunit IIA [Chlamydiales bacterium]|nr:PTS sugar transporter subunit IIA [Chlamydiales bacterium]